MRWIPEAWVGLIVGWWLIQGTLAAADDPFPYVARVAVDHLNVYCGPANDYYATQELERGDVVEVHQHEAEGWLAIRPPAGSFSWIAARHVQETANPRVAEVVVDQAVAWIGAESTGVDQYKWQVRLDRGERVEVLGREPLRIGLGAARETFVKIMPPAGEFRWVQARQTNAILEKSHRDAHPRVQLAEFRAVTDQSDRAASKRDRDGDVLAQRLEQLKIDLSLLVTRNIEAWDLATIEGRYRDLCQEAGDGRPDRELATIADRIEEIRGLQQRYEQLMATASTAETPRVNGVSAAPSDRSGIWDAIESLPIGTGVRPLAGHDEPILEEDELPLLDEEMDPSFAAQGWLVPVHSSKRIAPPFALLDDEGRVRCYVQPAPGLNLRRYTRTEVGLIGQSRKVPALRASLVTAERAVKIKTR